ncbi:hypothetical protein EDB86DRAFT_3082812 [Lactarius hatsudake]|nr:hypothetical protein EDB86DRAFT_3082812 [Lactarius hatsudake]
MLISDAMDLLVGPTPTLFSGDPAQAQQFIDEFGQLERANRSHPLMSRPDLRVELALTFIEEDPTTIDWKRTIRCKNDNGWADESVWDKFFDSFCTAWIDNTPAPVTQTPSSLGLVSPPIAADLVPEALATATLTPVDEPASILEPAMTLSATVSDLPPPRPPRSPRRPYSPRVAQSPSPRDNGTQTSLLPPVTDTEKEETLLTSAAPVPPAHAVPSPLPPAVTSALTPSKKNEDTALAPRILPVPTPTILSSPHQYPPSPTVSLLPHADGGENEEVLPNSTTISLPMTLPTLADKPLAPVATDPPLTVLVKTLSTRSVSDSPPPRPPCSPRHPSSPRIAPSPQPADNTQTLPVTTIEVDNTRTTRFASLLLLVEEIEKELALLASAPAPLTPALGPPFPPVPSTTTSNSPRPRPLRSPRRPVGPKVACQSTELTPLANFTLGPPSEVVEDDNNPGRGVKTLADSVFTPDLAELTPVNSPPPHPPHTPHRPSSPRLMPLLRTSDIFPRHTLEMPRDPDELANHPIYNQSRENARTQTPTSTHQRNGPRANEERVVPRTRLAPLTPADRERCRQEERCFRC